MRMPITAVLCDLVDFHRVCDQMGILDQETNMISVANGEKRSSRCVKPSLPDCQRKGHDDYGARWNLATSALLCRQYKL